MSHENCKRHNAAVIQKCIQTDREIKYFFITADYIIATYSFITYSLQVCINALLWNDSQILIS